MTGVLTATTITTATVTTTGVTTEQQPVDPVQATGHRRSSSASKTSTSFSDRDSNGILTPTSSSAAAANGSDHLFAHVSSPSACSSAHSSAMAAGTAASGSPPRPLAFRKHSTPLMPSYMVSAPGKVIVYGEHAVVYGKAAIAAAISLRSYLLVSFLSKSRRTVTLRFPDIGLDHTWNIDDLPWEAFSHPSKKKFYYDLVTSLDPDLVEAMQPHIITVSTKLPEPVRKRHQNSASAFLYLFLSLGSPQSAPCIYTLRSTIPIGAGLGSSASIAVCLSAALLLQIRALSGPHPDQPSQECELQIERINRWAFVGEMCIHGNPSGVDNTVSSGGKAVLFKRTDYSKPPTVTPLRSFPELPLLLVNTRQSRSTAVEVAKVAHLKKTHPIITAQLLDAIDKVTESAHRLLTSDGFDPEDPAALQHLGELITVNHGLLVSLGVSHPKLERIRALIDHAGIGWTKLTGAGGGGCAITILKPQAAPPPSDDTPAANGASPTSPSAEATAAAAADAKRATLSQLEQNLEREGFERFETTLAGDGVGVLWPAVLHNGTEEEGGEEIDVEKFLNAPGIDGVERLVGVEGCRRGFGTGVSQRRRDWREGWKFWRP